MPRPLYSSQAYHRDAFALTYHRRTFKTPQTISLALLKLSKERGTEGFQLSPGSQYMSVLPTLVSPVPLLRPQPPAC